MDLLLQLLAAGVVAGSIYALCAVGWGLIYGTTRHFHVAHGAVFTLAGYFAYVGQKLLGMPLWFAILAAIAAAAMAGLLIDFAVYQPLERRGATRTVIFIASLGLLIVVENVIAVIFTSDPLHIEIGALHAPLRMGSVYLTYLQALTVVVTLIGYCGLELFLRRTRWGHAIRAVSSAPEMARTVGISLGRVQLLTYALGSAISAPAGILLAMDVGTDPYRGTRFMLLAAVAVIMGGIGSLPGALIGGLLLGLVENLGIWQIPSQWQAAISFGVFLIFILMKPRGLFGRRVAGADL